MAALAAALALAGCGGDGARRADGGDAPARLAADPPAAPPARRAEPAPPEEPARDVGFDAWLAAFRQDARQAGVGEAVLDRELAGLAPDPRVLRLDRGQPDRAGSPLTFAAYAAAQLPAARLARGARLRSDLSATLSSVERQFSVPAELLVAIWGKESSFGVASGRLDVVRSLATLAYDGRRRALFTAELIAALRMLESGIVARDALRGSWAGATGQPQFMPTSYLAHAADGDGDGRRDIWKNRADALASIASFLAAHGWRPGEPWAVAVDMPAGFDRAAQRGRAVEAACPGLAWRHSGWLTAGEWRALGVRVPAHVEDRLEATLIEPDGPNGEAFLTFSNYRAIMAYNCTNFYALTVSRLAQSIAGATPGLRRAP